MRAQTEATFTEFEAEHELLDEVRAMTAERERERNAELIRPEHWAWLKDMPPAAFDHTRPGHEAFRDFLQRYIDQMQKLQATAEEGETLVLPADHPAQIFSDKLNGLFAQERRQIEETLVRDQMRSLESAGAGLNQQWGASPYIPQQYVGMGGGGGGGYASVISPQAAAYQQAVARQQAVGPVDRLDQWERLYDKMHGGMRGKNR